MQSEPPPGPPVEWRRVAGYWVEHGTPLRPGDQAICVIDELAESYAKRLRDHYRENPLPPIHCTVVACPAKPDGQFRLRRLGDGAEFLAPGCYLHRVPDWRFFSPCSPTGSAAAGFTPASSRFESGRGDRSEGGDRDA